MVIAALPARLLARCREPIRGRHLNVLWSSAILLVALATIDPDGLPGRCLVGLLFGVRCPFCGVTHAVARALRLDLGGAWAANPAGLLVAVILVLQVPLRAGVVAGWLDLKWETDRSSSRLLNGAVILACLAVYAWRSALALGAFGLGPG